MSAGRGLLGVGGVLVAFALAAAAFIVPPGLQDQGWDTDAYRYAALADGGAALTRVSEVGGGDDVTWESTSVSLLPGLKALGNLPPGLERAAIAADSSQWRQQAALAAQAPQFAVHVQHAL